MLGPVTAPTVSNRVLCDYQVGFLASPSLGLGNGRLTVHDLAKFPIITFPAQDARLTKSCVRCSTVPPCRRCACTPAPDWAP